MTSQSSLRAIGGDRSEGGLLAERVADHIRAMVASGQLGPGDKINEVEVAAELEISRGPVREAVRRLASSGLVVSERNLGSRVAQLDEVSIRGIYEVREALESMAARFAALRMTGAQKRDLLALLDAHEAAISKDGFDAYPAGTSDWDFHLAVLTGSQNAMASRICGGELRDMLALLRARHGNVPGRGKEALSEHRRVAEAIHAGDADIAAVLMAQHVRNSYRNIIALVEGSDRQVPTKGLR